MLGCDPAPWSQTRHLVVMAECWTLRAPLREVYGSRIASWRSILALLCVVSGLSNRWCPAQTCSGMAMMRSAALIPATIFMLIRSYAVLEAKTSTWLRDHHVLRKTLQRDVG